MPKTTVAAIITPPEQHPPRILLTRRSIEPFKDHWCLPGGHIDRYEAAQAAIVREVKEETGLDFNAHFVGYWDEIIPERDIHAVVLVFAGHGSGRVQVPSSEVTELRWFALDEARCLSLAFTHNTILDAYAR